VKPAALLVRDPRAVFTNLRITLKSQTFIQFPNLTERRQLMSLEAALKIVAAIHCRGILTKQQAFDAHDVANLPTMADQDALRRC